MSSAMARPAQPAADAEQTERVSSWTPQQLEAITLTEPALLVSAAAGSGKTAVLSERCATLVTAGENPCGVEELLVVTFTELAAGEMRHRIERALRDKLAVNPTPHLQRQIAIVDHAEIGTIHSFCARLLRRHFHRLGIDPRFEILDGDDATLLKAETMDDLLTDAFSGDAGVDPAVFTSVIDAYFGGSDEGLGETVRRIHDMLSSLADPQAWTSSALAEIEQGAAVQLRESSIGRRLLTTVERRVVNLSETLTAAIQGLAKLGNFDKLVQALSSALDVVEPWHKVLREQGLDALAEVVRSRPAIRRPSTSKSLPGINIADGLFKPAMAAYKESPLGDIPPLTEAQWRLSLERTAPVARLLLDLSAEFERRYARAKSIQRAMDFSDLERLALRALQNDDGSPSEVARQCHRVYRHVLVDEYQDINQLQDRILSLVSRTCLGEKGSGFFCVGDVKQSIYRFRLAEPSLFIDRMNAYRAAQARSPADAPARTIDLQNNYRSRGPLLEAVNVIFRAIMSESAGEVEYDDRQALIPGAAYPSGDNALTGAPVELHLLVKPTATEKTSGGAVAAGGGSARGESGRGDVGRGEPGRGQPGRGESGGGELPGSDNGVSESGASDSGGSDPLVESGDDAPGEQEDLENMEREAALVAYRMRQMMGLIDQPRVAVTDRQTRKLRPIRFGDFAVLMRAMRHKASQFATILRRMGIPVFTQERGGFFDNQEIADVLSLLEILDNPRQDIPLAAYLRGPLARLADPGEAMARIALHGRSLSPPVPFHQAVVSYARTESNALAARLRELLDQLDAWRQVARDRPVSELILTIYQQTGFPAFVVALPDGPQREANLHELHARAAQFSTFRKQGLSRFLRFLRSIHEETDLGAPSIAGAGVDVVQVMSIHQSKGLEFPVVFVPDMGTKFNLTSADGAIVFDRHALLGIEQYDPELMARLPSVSSVLVKQRVHDATMAEAMRVLYVAMTRAREHLVLVGTNTRKTLESLIASPTNTGERLRAEHVLSAPTALHWLIPAIKAAGAENTGHFRLALHDPPDLATWLKHSVPLSRRVDPRLAALKPLTPAPEPNVRADELIAALSWRYPHMASTDTPAVTSVTTLTKKGERALHSGGGGSDTGDFESPPPSPASAALRTRDFHAPRFTTGANMSAADKGTATHIALQYLPFDTPPVAASIAAAVDAMVRQKRLTAIEASAVDTPALAWFLSCELRRYWVDKSCTIYREQTVYFPHDPPTRSPGGDQYDRIMVRGRLDLLIDSPAGLVIIDYKTDRVETAEAVAGRVELYRPQLEMYQSALKAMTRRPVGQAYLVFLTPRQIVRL